MFVQDEKEAIDARSSNVIRALFCGWFVVRGRCGCVTRRRGEVFPDSSGFGAIVAKLVVGAL